MSQNAMASLLLGALAACSGFVSDDATRSTTSSRALDDWTESPFLSGEQRDTLLELREQTLQAGGSFSALVWEQGHALLDLQVKAPSSLEAGAIEEHATAFLAKYGALWHIDAADLGGRLQVVAVRKQDDCSSVDVQLHAGDLPVFNATLRLTITPEGIVRRVSGLMDAEPISFEIIPAEIGAEEAAKQITEEMGWGDDAVPYLPPGRLVVFDPYFVSGAEHAPAEAWYFQAEGASPNDGSLADGRTGSLLLHGPSLDALQVLGKANECDADAPPGNAWMANVVVDPLTQTPA